MRQTNCWGDKESLHVIFSPASYPAWLGQQVLAETFFFSHGVGVAADRLAHHHSPLTTRLSPSPSLSLPSSSSASSSGRTSHHRPSSPYAFYHTPHHHHQRERRKKNHTGISTSLLHSLRLQRAFVSPGLLPFFFFFEQQKKKTSVLR